MNDTAIPVMTVTASDAAAGLFLLIYGVGGIFLYILITIPMCRMSNEIVGFRFLISQAITDILLIVQFGVWPGLLILLQDEITPPSLRWHVHIYLDFTWWAMAYHYTIIAWSRLAAVQWPNWFRTLPHRSCVLICGIPWLMGLTQSLVEHQFVWFEPLWYDPQKYGMTANWAEYDQNGSNLYFMIFNVISMVLPFPFYVIALVVLYKRQKKRHLELKSRLCGMPVAMSSSLMASQRQLSIESRLLAPCIINTVLFVVGQIFITQLAKQGKWWNWSVLVVFATNSFVNPLLYLSFSSVIRKSVMSDVRKRFSLSAVYDYEIRWSSQDHRSSLIRLPKDTTVTSSLNNV